MQGISKNKIKWIRSLQQKKFRDDLAQLMLQYADAKKTYKSFASYQNDLTENLAPQQIMGNEPIPDDIFYNAPLFVK